MAENIILTVGNSMMGDDGAGPLLAELMTQTPLAGWEAIDGGTTPENVVHQIQAYTPKCVIIVDAADMGLEAGEVRFVDAQSMADLFIMSTHNLPLSFLMERLKENITEVLFIGIQPDIVAFGFPMSESVRLAVETLYHQLKTDPSLQTYKWL